MFGKLASPMQSLGASGRAEGLGGVMAEASFLDVGLMETLVWS